MTLDKGREGITVCRRSCVGIVLVVFTASIINSRSGVLEILRSLQAFNRKPHQPDGAKER